MDTCYRLRMSNDRPTWPDYQAAADHLDAVYAKRRRHEMFSPEWEACAPEIEAAYASIRRLNEANA